MTTSDMAIVIELLPFLATFWVFIYAFYHGVNNKFLFVSSVIGMMIITLALLGVVCLPIIIFMLKIAPSIAERGFDIYLKPLFEVVEFFYTYGGDLVYVLIGLLLPKKVHCRYGIFNSAANT